MREREGSKTHVYDDVSGDVTICIFRGRPQSCTDDNGKQIFIVNKETRLEKVGEKNNDKKVERRR